MGPTSVGTVTGEAMCPHILPKWLTRKHMAVSSSLFPELRVPLFSISHSFNKQVSSTQHSPGAVLSSLPSQICISVPSTCFFCLCLSWPQASALRAPSSLQSSSSASPWPRTSPVGLLSQKCQPRPHNLVSLPLPLLPRNISGLGSPRR